MTTGTNMIDRFVYQMNDSGNVRYSSNEVLAWINQGQNLIALVRPDAAAVYETLALSAGTKQALPSGGLRLLDVVRSVDPTTGATLRAVTYVDRTVLDRNPKWHTDTAAYAVAHFAYDERYPKTFWVWRPALAGAKIDISYTKCPTALSTAGSNVALDDIYLDPLLEYMLFRAYSFDRQYSLQPQLAAQRLQNFNSMLGVKVTRDRAMSPELNNPGANPPPAMIGA
jgi:hypothetical protein